MQIVDRRQFYSFWRRQNSERLPRMVQKCVHKKKANRNLFRVRVHSGNYFYFPAMFARCQQASKMLSAQWEFFRRRRFFYEWPTSSTDSGSMTSFHGLRRLRFALIFHWEIYNKANLFPREIMLGDWKMETLIWANSSSSTNSDECTRVLMISKLKIIISCRWTASVWINQDLNLKIPHSACKLKIENKHDANKTEVRFQSLIFWCFSRSKYHLIRKIWSTQPDSHVNYHELLLFIISGSHVSTIFD